MNLAEILRGTHINYEAIQSIQGLTIVPLVCNREFSFDDKYASPYDHNISTSSYGTVHAEPAPSAAGKLVLIAPQSSYITSYAAQDHLISKGVLLENSPKTLKDSRCVESSQGGMIRSTGDNRLVIAPLKLREVALNYVGTEGYNKLWNSIGVFNREHGAGSQQQIKSYFAKWDKDLDEFISHFERLDNCIGFITLYKDEVVAVDKFPSFTYTSQIWDRLVRDSYASLVIHDRLKGNVQSTTLKTATQYGDGESLSEVYRKMVKERNDHYKVLMSELVDVDFKTKDEKDTPGSIILESDGYIGQVIEENGFNVMTSIIKKDAFDPNANRSARTMRKLAATQEDFSL